MSGNEGISVADALALRNSSGDGGFGNGDSAWWIVILVLLFGAGGWGRNGGFGSSGGDACCHPATQQGMTDAFNFSQLDNGIRSLANGLCDGFYAQNNSINSVLSALQNCCCETQRELCQGFGGVNNSIMQANFQNQAGFNALTSQIAQCCCDVRYDMASQACDTRNLIQSTTRDIIDNQNYNTRSILDFLTQSKIDALRDENQALRFQASQSAQNAFISANQEAQTAEIIRRLGRDPVAAYVVPNPYGYGYGVNNCGCGCGCNNGCC